MTKPTIQQFDLVPLRNMTQEEFDAASLDFWPRVKPFAEDLKEAVDYIEASLNTADGSVQAAQAAQTGAESARDAAQGHSGDALTQANRAQDEADRAEAAVAALPEGTINDAITSPTTAWSSEKIAQEIAGSSNLDIGAVTYSFSDLTASGDFVRPGMTYLQSAYPDLFAVIGIGSAPPISKLTNPANLPGSAARNVTSSTNDDYVAVVGQTDPKLTLYSRSGDILTREDFVSTSDTHLTFGGNTDLTLILVGCFGSPYLKLYSRSGGLLTEESAPSSGLSGSVSVEGCGFNYNGSYAAFLANDALNANLRLYSVSGTSLTQTDAISTVTPSSAVSLAIHPLQNYLVCALDNATVAELYSFSGGTLTLEQSIPETDARSSDFRKSVQWSPDGNFLTLCTDQLVRVFSFSAGSLTEITQTFAGETGSPDVTSASISKDGDFITLGFNASPYIKVYDFDAGVIGSSYTATAAPSVNVLAAYSSPYTGFTYTVLSAGDNFAYYKSNFPFDTATEFYVPDIDDLSPQQVGDWIPSAQAKAYVRAQ
ncbi:hypothetical protein PRZ61_10945 [Halomonas pacifica]|uniref:hypothetical protein n=1 Tax=Bisbaumannia pacifica TaxID=77098 RepID=UPI0023588CD8|nr:hypothetical protein [Halomonas pacifica]MDC8803953.1 hypothetical protein [Halomonas pacifica]